MLRKFNMYIVVIIITFYMYLVKSDLPLADQLTLRSELFDKLFVMQQSLDRLNISVENLNKSYSNQIDMVKEIQQNFNDDNVQDNCNKIGTIINTTNRKLNTFEVMTFTKLKQIQDEQTALLDHIKLRENANKSCSSPVDATMVPNAMSPILSDINTKVDEFVHKLTNLESQQNKLEQFNQDQMKILQDINAKLTKNQEQFEMFEKEMPIIKNMIAEMNQVVHKEPAKLPQSYLLGLTNAKLIKTNLTKT